MMAKIILHQDWSSKHLFSSLLEIWEARLSHPIMGGNGWFDVASGRGLGSFPTLCQKGHTRRKSQGNGCKAPIQMRHPISSFHAIHGSTSGSLDPNRRKWHPFWSLWMHSEIRNSMIQKSKGWFGVRGFRDTWWCNPVTLPVLAVNQHAWHSQTSGKAAFHSFLCLQV